MTEPEGTPPEGTPPEGTPGDEPKSTVLPDHIKSMDSMKDIKDIENLVKSFENAQTMIGKRALVLPEANDPPEKWKEFHESVGAAKSSEGYDFKMEKPPEGVNVSEKFDKYMKEVFHEQGLRPSQGRTIYLKQMSFFADEAKEMPAKLEQAVADLEQESKTKFGEAYAETVELGQRAINYMQVQGLVDKLKHYGLETDPDFLEGFSKIGRLITEAHGEGGSPASGFTNELTPEQAKLKMNALGQDAEFMKLYTSDPTILPDKGSLIAINEAKAKMKALMLQAWPEVDTKV